MWDIFNPRFLFWDNYVNNTADYILVTQGVRSSAAKALKMQESRLFILHEDKIELVGRREKSENFVLMTQWLLSFMSQRYEYNCEGFKHYRHFALGNEVIICKFAKDQDSKSLVSCHALQLS